MNIESEKFNIEYYFEHIEMLKDFNNNLSINDELLEAQPELETETNDLPF